MNILLIEENNIFIGNVNLNKFKIAFFAYKTYYFINLFSLIYLYYSLIK